MGRKREMSLIDPVLVNPNQVGELMSPIIVEVLKLSQEKMQYWIGHKTQLALGIRRLFISAGEESAKIFEEPAPDSKISEELQSWLALYREEFKLELDLETLSIPPYRDNTWLVIADKRVTERMAYDACVKHFSCNKDIDLSVVHNLHITGTTARRFRATVEADEEHKNTSANVLRDAGLEPKSITLKERILLELWYSRTTNGAHLDTENWTLCNGSRDDSGYVPRAYWSSDHCGFHVSWYHPERANDRLRSRVAVS